jgi:hypothetical protein
MGDNQPLGNLDSICPGKHGTGIQIVAGGDTIYTRDNHDMSP